MYAKHTHIYSSSHSVYRFNLSLTSSLPFVLLLSSLNSVGEISAGKASRSLAQHMPGPGGIEGMKGAASGVVGDLARARIALDERGQKLGELDERTAAMMASADSFSSHAHQVNTKCLQVYHVMSQQGMFVHTYLCAVAHRMKIKVSAEVNSSLRNNLLKAGDIGNNVDYFSFSSDSTIRAGYNIYTISCKQSRRRIKKRRGKTAVLNTEYISEC